MLSSLKNFYKKYSKQVFKFISSQIVMSVFGVLVNGAAILLNNTAITVIAELLSMLMFCYFVYEPMYELGQGDNIRIGTGRQDSQPFTGLKISLLAYSPTIFIVTMMSIFFWVGLDDASAVLIVVLTLLIHGQYMGLWSILSSLPIPVIAFICLIPALLSGYLGYLLGLKDIHLRKILGLQYPKPPKRTKKK